MRNFPTLEHAKKRLFLVLVHNKSFNKAIWLKLINRFDTFLLSNELEPSPSPGPSKKFNPEP